MLSEGWNIDRAIQKVNLAQRGSTQFLEFMVEPSKNAKSGLMSPLVHRNGEKENVFAVQKINYAHIPKQYVAQPKEAKLVRLNLNLPQKKIGYIMGAGDFVKENLEAIGLEVTNIDIERITQEELNEFDTVLVGIRAFNILESLKYKNQCFSILLPKGAHYCAIQYQPKITNQRNPPLSHSTLERPCYRRI